MSFDTILVEQDNNVQTIFLNRPERLNAWTQHMSDEIRQSMRDAANDDNVKVIIITGTGRGFCAGADMDSLNSLDAEQREQEGKNSVFSIR